MCYNSGIDFIISNYPSWQERVLIHRSLPDDGSFCAALGIYTAPGYAVTVSGYFMEIFHLENPCQTLRELRRRRSAELIRVNYMHKREQSISLSSKGSVFPRGVLHSRKSLPRWNIPRNFISYELLYLLLYDVVGLCRERKIVVRTELLSRSAERVCSSKTGSGIALSFSLIHSEHGVVDEFSNI